MLTPSICDQGALAHWSNPNVALVSFNCGARPDTIDPSDGRLLVGNRKFAIDRCIAHGQQFEYPEPLQGSDLTIDFECSSGLAEILVARTGQLAFGCDDEWFDEDGVLLFTSTDRVLKFDGERFLTSRGVFNIATQVLLEFEGFPGTGFKRLTSRIKDQGYQVVLSSTSSTDDDEIAELWNVSVDAVAERVGNFPALPEGVYSTSGPHKLDAAGWLYTMGNDSSVAFNEVIARRHVNGTSEVVYDELQEPYVKLHGSTLATGP